MQKETWRVPEAEVVQSVYPKGEGRVRAQSRLIMSSESQDLLATD